MECYQIRPYPPRFALHGPDSIDHSGDAMKAPLLILAVTCGYGAMVALACVALLFMGGSPFVCAGWLGMGTAASSLSSAGIGVCLGAATVGATREIVRRASWGRALHRALRPAVGRAKNGTLLALALASALGEEAFFRGLLVPLVGVVLSALIFGALHQIRGPGRLAWMAWATVMGLLFGILFAATGSLIGPIVAHAIINAANLRFLRDNDPEATPKPLGGLLRRT
jgi:membrane protease YdiL (CAAX protease family)